MTELLWPSLLVLALSTALFFIAMKRRISSSSSSREGEIVPPGSLGLPFIGETMAFLQSLKANRAQDFFEARVGRFGPVFKTRLAGDVPLVVPYGVPGNRLALVNEDKLVEISWPGSVIDLIGRQSLVNKHGLEFRRLRRALMSFLLPDALCKYVPRTDRSARLHIQKFWLGRDIVEVYPAMKDYTFSLACDLFMSHDSEVEQKILEEPFMDLVKGMFQIPINIPATKFHKAKVARRIICDQLDVWIAQRRKELSDGSAYADCDLLSCLLNFKDDSGIPLTDEDIKDNIIILLFAGHDTTTIVLTMLCKFLAENPHIYEEIVKEQQEIASSKASDEPLTWEDIKKMSLSWRAMQEAMRLQPPVLGGFRKVIKTFKYEGYTIPEGWKLYWTSNSTHMNPEYFKDPEKFDPSRFEGGQEPYTFLPFGGGQRICPGSEYAKMAMLTMLHYLVLTFRWSLVHPDEHITISPMPYPTLGLPVKLESKSI